MPEKKETSKSKKTAGAKKEKPKKSVAKKEPNVTPVTPTRARRLRTPRVVSARDFLMRAGVKPNHIPTLVAAARSKGHTAETIAQWKEIFKSI